MARWQLTLAKLPNKKNKTLNVDLFDLGETFVRPYIYE